MKKIKHILGTLLTIAVIILLMRLGIIDSLSDLLNTEENSNTSDVVTDAQTINTDLIEMNQNTNIPTLPDDNYSDMDLFEDGYQTVTLVDVLDGDTAIFNINGTHHKTRFLAVDTPEVDADLRDVEAWGSTASAYTKDRLRNANEIVLQLDPDSDTFDKYDRLLAWIWVDETLYNYEIVSQGLADVNYLYGDYLYTDDLLDAQETAKAQGLKIWGEKDPNFDY